MPSAHTVQCTFVCAPRTRGPGAASPGVNKLSLSPDPNCPWKKNSRKQKSPPFPACANAWSEPQTGLQLPVGPQDGCKLTKNIVAVSQLATIFFRERFGVSLTLRPFFSIHTSMDMRLPVGLRFSTELPCHIPAEGEPRVSVFQGTQSRCTAFVVHTIGSAAPLGQTH